MKTIKGSKRERLEFFRSLYENAKDAYADSLMHFDRAMEQYLGSHKIDGGEDALVVRNITYEIIESQIGSNIPSPKADASYYTDERARLAHTVESLLKALRAKLPFEEQNDLEERATYIYGGSVRYVEWDNTLECAGARGGIRIHYVSARDFIPQPNVFSTEDMEYCFLRFTSTRGEIMERYGITERESEGLELEIENAGSDAGDTVSMIVTFFRNEENEISQFIFSGDVTLADVDGYYKRKIPICKSCGMREGLCTCGNGADTELCDVDDEIVPEKYGKSFGRVPYYTPRHFPIVIRKNTSLEKSLFGQSDCDYIRPMQQSINKVESRILQKLLRSGVTPIVPEDATVSVNNSVFGQVIKMRPGESMAQYGTVDTTPDISQDIAEAERLYSHAKRILGISDAYQGISHSGSESGYARQLQIAQASGRLESKKMMKHASYAKLDRMIFEHYLAFADEERQLDYKDAFGIVHKECFNKYDFLRYDTERGFYYDDDFLFSVDLDGGSEYQKEALWQRNLENLTAGTLGNPESTKTLLRYWQYQERAHYPFARDNVEYFSELLKNEENAALAITGGGDIPNEGGGGSDEE